MHPGTSLEEKEKAARWLLCSHCGFKTPNWEILEKHWAALCFVIPRQMDCAGEVVLSPAPSPNKNGANLHIPPRDVDVNLWIIPHEQRLQEEFVRVMRVEGISRLEVHDDSETSGQNWVFQEDLLDITSVLNIAFKHGVPNAAVEEYVKLFQRLAPESARIQVLPKTFRTMKNRVMAGFTPDDYVRCEYEFPDNLPVTTKTAPFLLKKFDVALTECLTDPRLMEPGNFYFGDSGSSQGKGGHLAS